MNIHRQALLHISLVCFLHLHIYLTQDQYPSSPNAIPLLLTLKYIMMKNVFATCSGWIEKANALLSCLQPPFVVLIYSFILSYPNTSILQISWKRSWVIWYKIFLRCWQVIQKRNLIDPGSFKVCYLCSSTTWANNNKGDLFFSIFVCRKERWDVKKWEIRLNIILYEKGQQ